MDSSAPWRALESSEPVERETGSPGASGGHPLAPLLAIAGVAALALVAGFVVVAAAAAPAAPVIVTGSSPPATGAATGSLLVIEVAGAVVRPGVYELPAGSRIRDAIERAGGYGPDVDADAAESGLNLAAKLADGEVIRVPRRGDESGEPSIAARPSSGLIDLNTASPEQLDSLPGIGPVTAAKIVAARQEKPFASVDDLVTRKVLSASALTKIRSLVTVR